MSDIAERSEFGVQDAGQWDPVNLRWRLMVERLGSAFKKKKKKAVVDMGELKTSHGDLAKGMPRKGLRRQKAFTLG